MKTTDLSKLAEVTMKVYEEHMEKSLFPKTLLTDKIIVETVPKYILSIPIPYFYTNDYGDWSLGVTYHELLRIGKKKIKRKAYIWEGKKLGKIKIPKLK